LSYLAVLCACTIVNLMLRLSMHGEIDRSPFRLFGEHLWKRRGTLSLMVLLTMANVLVYWQVWKFDFVVIDDLVYVSDNPHVLTGVNLRNLFWSFTTFHGGYWIPLTWLSLMLDAQIYGRFPGGYHVTNLLLHAVNSLLLFWFLNKATQNQIRSVFVAALFALHPLHVESVAWVTERKDVLSTLFGLLSLIAYVRGVREERRSNLVVSFLFFVCSLASKPTLVTLPFIFLLLDFWPLRRFGTAIDRQVRAGGPALANDSGGPRIGEWVGRTLSFRAPTVVQLLAEKAPFIAASVAFSIITFIAQRSAEAVKSLAGYPFSARCLNALVVYVAYLRKTVIPDDLAVFYPHPKGQLALTTVAVAAAVIIAISVAAVIWARRYPFLLVGWCWYLGTLVPMIGIVQVGRQQMADRFTYFPLIGLFLAFVWLAAELAPAGIICNRVLQAAGISGVVALAAASFVQVGYWHDNIALFRHALECGQDSALARSCLGSLLVAQGEATEGMALLESAVALDGEDPEFEFNLAVALQTHGQLDAAARHYETALKLHERDADVHSNLGLIQLRRHEYQVAKRNFTRAIEIDPDDVRPYVNLGTLFLETGEYAEAIANSQRALDLDPDSIKAHHNLAVALLCQGRLDEAISQFRYLASVLPDDRQTQLNLERALAMKQGSSGR